jgi:ubiquinone/menaquinone biosynthesis C-methylase UbiE
VARAKPGLIGKLILAEAEHLPLPDGVADLVLCAFAINYFRSAPAAFAEMARITRKGGRVIISDLHPIAVMAGWKRSFRIGGSQYEIDHDTWNIRRLNAPAARHELAMEWQIDAHFGIPERKIFREAGKASQFVDASSIPAVRMVCWTKP